MALEYDENAINAIKTKRKIPYFKGTNLQLHGFDKLRPQASQRERLTGTMLGVDANLVPVPYSRSIFSSSSC